MEEPEGKLFSAGAVVQCDIDMERGLAFVTTGGEAQGGVVNQIINDAYPDWSKATKIHDSTVFPNPITGGSGTAITAPDDGWIWFYPRFYATYPSTNRTQGYWRIYIGGKQMWSGVPVPRENYRQSASQLYCIETAPFKVSQGDALLLNLSPNTVPSAANWDSTEANVGVWFIPNKARISDAVATVFNAHVADQTIHISQSEMDSVLQRLAALEAAIQ